MQTEPVRFTCDRCNYSLKVRVWPLYCRCGMTYRDANDKGLSRYRRGLGDLVADTLRKLGIKKKKKCKCKERQDSLNKMMPFKHG